MRTARGLIASLAALLLGAAPGNAAPGNTAAGNPTEHIKMCAVRSLGSSPSIIAKDKGFFAKQGLDTEIVLFESAQPIAVAVTSGDCDFAATGMTAALFNLAGQGALKIIGAGTWEHKGFQSVGMLVSNQAYQAGLHSFEDLGGHSVAITQLGTPLQFFVVQIAQMFRIDPGSIKFLALQSNGTVASAIAGGQADTAVQTVASLSAVIGKGDGRLLGWINDVLPPHQGEAVFTATKTANERPAVVNAFLKGLREAEAYCHDAFADAEDKRRDGPTANEVIAIEAKYLQQPESAIRLGIPYFDPQSRVAPKDIEALMNWYKEQHMLKPDVDVKTIVDTRYAIEMPQ